MKYFTLLSLITLLSYWAKGQTPQLLGDIHIPTSHPFEFLSGPFQSIHDKVIFYGLTYNQGYGFWAYNGEGPAKKISHEGSSVSGLAPTADGFYFISPFDVTKYWLYKHGGTPGVTFLIDEVKSNSQNNIPSIASLNGKVFYQDWEATTGYELWCAGDSFGSAYLVKDCKPGITSTFPKELTTSDNLVYFWGGGTVPRELWRSDGTEAGTFKVFQTTSSNYYIQNASLRIIENKACFLVKKNTGETEFWISDGTIAGTSKATDLPPSTIDQTYFEAFVLNGKYVYLANDQQNPNLEWIATDGTSNGTEILLDFPANADYYLIPNGGSAKSILNGSFFFMYTNPDNDSELWKSDGTASGTLKIKTIEKNSASLLCSSKQDFFFLIQTSPNDTLCLWASDGTPTGTRKVKYLGNDGYIYGDLGAAALDSSILFPSPFFGPGIVEFPYRSDGTEQGTYPLMGAPATHLAGSNPVGFVSGPGDAFFFRADVENAYSGVWRTEPSAPFSITLLDTTSQDMYLEVATPMSIGNKVLWFSDKNTLRFTEASGAINQFQLPVNFSGSWDYGPGGAVYFIANNNKSLWRLSGAPAAFNLLSGSANSQFYGLKAAGDSLYFIERFTLPNQPNFLWSSDGTVNGTQIIGVIQDGSIIFLRAVENRIAYSTSTFNPYARTLYVRGFDPVYFPDLNFDDFAGLAITDSQLFVLGPRVYGPADSFHYSLWTAENGQPNLLRKFKGIAGHQYYDSRPQEHLHRLGNSVLFGAGLTENNVELWISDGTTSGTNELRDLHPSGSSNPDNFVHYNDQLWLFTANDGTEVSWWATDGTGAGTFKVAALATVKDYFVPSINSAHLSGNRLFFSMNDGIVGQEPWVMVLEDSLMVSTLAPLSVANELSIWPNPAKDMVNLSLENQIGKPVWVKITNNTGQVVYQKRHILPDAGPLTIPLLQQSKGIHFLQVSTENGKIWTKKLIIAE
ncbi:MAG: T9SS type A sorting domain-containing protein [Saprospiraceae bacterium]